MPQAVAGISGNSVVAASNHTCVHDDADALWCFGANGSGECGSAPEPSVRATRVGITASDVATGAEHTCAIATDGTVRCWGSNRYGQLGDGTRADSSSPRAVRVQ
jgi:alpha-tubulin suppressor-like RCC1 family protein